MVLTVQIDRVLLKLKLYSLVLYTLKLDLPLTGVMIPVSLNIEHTKSPPEIIMQYYRYIIVGKK